MTGRIFSIVSTSFFFLVIVLARLGVIYLPHLPPFPDVLLVTHYFIVFFLFPYAVDLWKSPKSIIMYRWERLLSPGVPSDHRAPVTMAPCWNEAQVEPLAWGHLPWLRSPVHSPLPCVSHGRLPEVVSLCHSENINGLIVEFSGSGPSFEEERSYFAPTSCG